jgi:hypothetical protein
MRRQDLILLVSAGLVFSSVAGCAGDKAQDSTAAAPVATAASSAPAGLDDATRRICEQAVADIAATAESVAQAKSLGGSSGGAQASGAYLAGNAQIRSDVVNTTNTAVQNAGIKVGDEMQAVAEAYVADFNGTPSTAALDNAIIDFKIACAAK